MQIFSTPAEMQAWSNGRRAAGHRIGFVPTMGALHTGHIALIEDAAERTDDVVVSIFVNPLQFNEGTDFDGYPRPFDDDVAACEHAGVAAVFAPTAAAMYPAGFQTRVVPGPLGDVMEGPNRPGHFEGVVTVVAKLFGAVRPHVAVFGQKDYQQFRIITQMAADLEFGIDIVGHPIERDPDGLAQSSRNVRLTGAQRVAAVVVPRALDAAIAAAGAGDVADLVRAAMSVIDVEDAAVLEYVTVFDAVTLVELDNLTGVPHVPGLARIATAVWFGNVRLIDNRDLFEHPTR
jgi:pantoate--beta-alanine ligase